MRGPGARNVHVFLLTFRTQNLFSRRALLAMQGLCQPGTLAGEDYNGSTGQPELLSACVISKSVPPTNSMIETAKATNLDPYRYLTWVLTNASILASSGYDWTTGLQPAHTTDHCRSPYRYVSDFEKRAEHGSFSHTCILRSLRFSHEKRPTHISESVFLSG